MTTNRAIFLDRDGVLNELVYYPDHGEDESPRRPDDLRLMPGVLDALHVLQDDGWLLFIISNQPSYAKGKTTLGSLHQVHDVLLASLPDVEFAAAYYSYTHPQATVLSHKTESVYRKPMPGYLLEAQRDHGINVRQSWIVGDRDTDILCGQHVQMNTALITYPLSRHKHGQSSPDITCKDLPDFTAQLKTMGEHDTQ